MGRLAVTGNSSTRKRLAELSGAATDTILFSDDFNRADSGNLGANWTTNSDVTAIVSNTAKCSSGSSASWNYWVGSPGNDQFAEVDVVTNLGQICSVFVRYDSASPTNTFYTFRVDDTGADTYQLYKRVSGTYTLLSSLAETFPSYPFRIRIQVKGTALKGQLYSGGSWVDKCTATDAAISAGKFGFSLQRVSSPVAADNFIGGTPA